MYYVFELDLDLNPECLQVCLNIPKMLKLTPGGGGRMGCVNLNANYDNRISITMRACRKKIVENF